MATLLDAKAISELARFWAKVDVPTHGLETACWIWRGYTDKAGYGVFRPFLGGPVRAHRYVYLLSREDAPEVVRHKCDTPACVSPYHLEGGTHADNVADRVERGRSARGDRNGRSTGSGQS